MGPHSFKCGSSLSPNGFPCGRITLQWGRTLSSAEVMPSRESIEKIVNASMGPHSFKCGSPAKTQRASKNAARFNGAALFQVRKLAALAAEAIKTLRLQWGRTLSSAEVG